MVDYNYPFYWDPFNQAFLVDDFLAPCVSVIISNPNDPSLYESTTALIDTGTDYCCVPEELGTQLALPPAGGDQVRLARINIESRGNRPAIVWTKDPYELMVPSGWIVLGRNLLNDFDIFLRPQPHPRPAIF